MCDWNEVVLMRLDGCVDSGGSTIETASPCLINKKRFYLDGPFVGVYLTFREAQSLHYYLLGLTLVDVAVKLGLSHRTVEYYIANVKKKLRVRTKQELLQGIKLTHFRFTA